HGVIVPISARISPGDQPRRPVGDDEQRVGLALDAMGRRLRSPRLPGVDVPGVDVPGVLKRSSISSSGDGPTSPGGCDGPTSPSACWPTVLPSGIVALRGRLTHGPRAPAARRACRWLGPARTLGAPGTLGSDTT